MAYSPLWEGLLGRALARVDRNDSHGHLPSICLTKPCPGEDPLADIETFDGPGPWDRAMVELGVQDTAASALKGQPVPKKAAIMFSGNDYLNLSSHPAVRKAAAKAALVYGMGPRASSMTCGHTDHHRLLEDCLAEMTKKDACVITPTGFAANTAFLTALGSVASLTAAGRKVDTRERIAIFADVLCHASVVDGLRLVERYREADIFVYRHNDMEHLDELLSKCPAEKKVVYTESLFSTQGDFAPLLELVELRKKHGLLVVVDDAQTILVCGRNGGGIAEVYGIQDQIDICVGTLSKATGCQGGFIACSKRWKKLIQRSGRPYIFTAAAPVPIVAACYAAVTVGKKESWRRQAVWSRVQEFAALTRLPAVSPVISLVVGSEQAALSASRYMLQCGFHVAPIMSPAVAPDACRLQVTLTAAHTSEDVRRLVATLSHCVPALQRADDDQIASRLLLSLDQGEVYAQSNAHTGPDSFLSSVNESILAL
uniref:serine C-palmitoyltransferase n=1 Tax=Anthurium amnicola TaxID=1678845 RepID=A0A1D1YZL5_9ARAE